MARVINCNQQLNIDFFEAVRRGDLAAIKFYVHVGADVNFICNTKVRWTPLMFLTSYAGFSGPAVYANVSQIVRLLVKAGADVNHQTANGMTALMRASYYGLMDVVTALLEAGANPVITDKKGRTAFTFAGYARNEHIITLLNSVTKSGIV